LTLCPRTFQTSPAATPGCDNLTIQSDNLNALKSLMPYVAGRGKCVFIDTPYNTGCTFEHYEDNVKYSSGLSLKT
jgi:adenine-specific DNA-methyltransferase